MQHGDDMESKNYMEPWPGVESAVGYICAGGRVSISGFQRHFCIDYSCAALLMDRLVRCGLVGPADGAKPRDVLFDLEKPVAALRCDATEDYDEQPYLADALPATGGALPPKPDSPPADAEDEVVLAAAIEYIRKTGRTSATSLQRGLKMGYCRAARLLEILENRRVVSAPNAAGKRLRQS